MTTRALFIVFLLALVLACVALGLLSSGCRNREGFVYMGTREGWMRCDAWVAQCTTKRELALCEHDAQLLGCPGRAP